MGLAWRQENNYRLTRWVQSDLCSSVTGRSHDQDGGPPHGRPPPPPSQPESGSSTTWSPARKGSPTHASTTTGNFVNGKKISSPDRRWTWKIFSAKRWYLRPHIVQTVKERTREDHVMSISCGFSEWAVAVLIFAHPNPPRIKFQGSIDAFDALVLIAISFENHYHYQ